VTSNPCPNRTERAGSTNSWTRPETPPEEEKELPCSRESINSPSCATPAAETPERAEAGAGGCGDRDGVWSRESFDRRPSSAVEGGGSGEAIGRNRAKARHTGGREKIWLVPLVPTRLIRPRAPQGPNESIQKLTSLFQEGGTMRIVCQFRLDPLLTWRADVSASLYFSRAHEMGKILLASGWLSHSPFSFLVLLRSLPALLLARGGSSLWRL